ncbi:MAG TPA: SIS domain-containing protein [Candidatus Paceibacterota bacterium]|nr:SIS domain-containing protein [Candidatus Paceibacterota bacterium]
MEEQLLSLPEQFSWEPAYDGPAGERFLVCGMGGSHLAASLLLVHDPALPIRIHRDYGLPAIPDAERAGTLVIVSSYSGNTEEELDAAEAALEAGFPTVAITTGGRLAEFAVERGLPLIRLPDSDVEPRMAIGHALLALAAVIGGQDLVEEVRAIGSSLDPEAQQEMGSEVGSALTERIPLIYATTEHEIVARMWKIFLNETAKVPAFSYSVPEFCHNELSGFDTAPATEILSERMLPMFLTSDADHPRNTLRMEIARDLLNERGIDTIAVPLEGETALGRALSGIATGVWAALALAAAYDVPDAKTPLIAEFKERMQDV